jgi:hypothetical protein
MGKKNKEIDADELLRMKQVHYGDIHECPHSQLLITARMLDKTRRLIQREYLHQVLADFGDIPGVSERIGDIDAVVEDTVADLENYIKLFKAGKEKQKRKEKGDED